MFSMNNGVQIMTPAYMADPAQAKIVPKDQWYAAPASPPDNENAGSAKEKAIRSCRKARDL